MERPKLFDPENRDIIFSSKKAGHDTIRALIQELCGKKIIRAKCGHCPSSQTFINKDGESETHHDIGKIEIHLDTGSVLIIKFTGYDDKVVGVELYGPDENT